MSLVAVVIPVTLLLVLCGVWAFFWAVRTGQFEELDVPAWEILIEEHGASRSAGGAGSAVVPAAAPGPATTSASGAPSTAGPADLPR